jgi:hypothetical protein
MLFNLYLADRNYQRRFLLAPILTLGTCLPLLLHSAAIADCGKIIIIQIPGGIDINKLLEALGFQPQGDPNVKPPKPDVDPIDPNGGGGGGGGGGGENGGGGDNGGGGGEAVELPGGNSNSAVERAARYYKANPKVFSEPVQKGLIGWNGQRELLILSTQEKALAAGSGGKATMMLSFMPLPGKCHAIRESNIAVINKAFDKIESKLPKKKETNYSVRGGLQLEKKIGPHTIFVWRVDTRKEFASDVQSYLKKRFRGKAAALFTSDTYKVLDEYFGRGYRYFAFDVIDMSRSDLSEKRAIAYEFDTNYLFYPLRVSQSGGTGTTKVSLAVFTKGRWNYLKGLTADQLKREGEKTVNITAQELREIDSGLSRLMGGQAGYGRIWELNGDLDKFSHDLIAYDH